MLYEVELKFALPAPADVIAKLISLGAVAASPIDQSDRYFNHPARDFGETDEAFRIRSVGEFNCLTYKGPRIDSTSKTRKEIEVSFAEGSDTARQLAEICLSLGFRFVREVRKTRTPFALIWRGTSFDIALDVVSPIGTFLEIERQADELSRDSVRDSILELAHELSLTNPERRSYLELLIDAESR